MNSGEYACAFSMFPTSIEDLMTIADAGGIMPPKSTWFEPKLRDAMFCHMIKGCLVQSTCIERFIRGLKKCCEQGRKMVRTNMQDSWSIPGVIGVSDNFGNTDWWVVRQASREGEPEADPARSRLCQDYWRPVFRYIRRLRSRLARCAGSHARVFLLGVEEKSLKTAAQHKGKFRSFLLTLLKRFLADECDRARCQKRGGDAQLLSLDGGDTEFRRRVEPINELNPEQFVNGIG